MPGELIELDARRGDRADWVRLDANARGRVFSIVRAGLGLPVGSFPGLCMFAARPGFFPAHEIVRVRGVGLEPLGSRPLGLLVPRRGGAGAAWGRFRSVRELEALVARIPPRISEATAVDYLEFVLAVSDGSFRSPLVRRAADLPAAEPSVAGLVGPPRVVSQTAGDGLVVEAALRRGPRLVHAAFLVTHAGLVSAGRWRVLSEDLGARCDTRAAAPARRLEA